MNCLILFEVWSTSGNLSNKELDESQDYVKNLLQLAHMISYFVKFKSSDDWQWELQDL